MYAQKQNQMTTEKVKTNVITILFFAIVQTVISFFNKILFTIVIPKTNLTARNKKKVSRKKQKQRCSGADFINKPSIERRLL